jgi:hypothetical protein
MRAEMSGWHAEALPFHPTMNAKRENVEQTFVVKRLKMNLLRVRPNQIGDESN